MVLLWGNAWISNEVMFRPGRIPENQPNAHFYPHRMGGKCWDLSRGPSLKRKQIQFSPAGEIRTFRQMQEVSVYWFASLDLHVRLISRQTEEFMMCNKDPQ